MQNQWNNSEAEARAQESMLGLRVYSSILLGNDADLVLHGGGNTSVKGSLDSVFGETESVLFVKGSGWDLRTIEAAGFPPVKLDYLLRLGDLPALSDSEMMRQLRLALLDPSAPTPSVEAILHALIPFKYVDHSHADAVVTISNTAAGEQLLREIYGKDVLILPYIMPGFILARQVAEAARSLDWGRLRGIILMHHGIFTFAEDARSSYDNMIELVSMAESYLQQNAGSAAIARGTHEPTLEDCLQLALLRQKAAALYAGPVLARLDSGPEAAGFAALPNAGELASRGPLTPDHSIHAKAFAAVFENDPEAGLNRFALDYQAYFEAHASTEHRCLDKMPRYGVWRDRGMVYLAPSQKRLNIVQDITAHTLKAIQQGEALGGWQALPRADLFAVEYWELEQAKLKAVTNRAEFEGKVALISGAASGIGRACVEECLNRGAAVIALDLVTADAPCFDHPAVLALRCDVTSNEQIEAALIQAVTQFGGIDLLISNAGSFPASARIEDLSDQGWGDSLELNLSSHMRVLRACLPFLKRGFDPAVVMVASKNVPAPGPGAAAYSAAKAGLTQLARVAALESGADGIRVNVVHPNAVYDTAIWTEEVLSKRAAHYGLSVEEYKTSNVLKTEVNSADVAMAVVELASVRFARTTGAQVPVDGGNDRVI
jgi:rhamnose utilization protein RhaD (predicted bifunctional aldolase and dehydrogenase)/NAD(P)-dependent dehydrogenase (short-subunit alcohol dehydrogenase family)